MTTYAEAVELQVGHYRDLVDPRVTAAAQTDMANRRDRDGLPPVPEGANERVRRVALHTTKYGETFYWTSDTLEVICASLGSLPPMPLSSEGQFSRVGWALFEQPIHLPKHPSGVEIAGVSWIFHKEEACQILLLSTLNTDVYPSDAEFPEGTLTYTPLDWKYGVAATDLTFDSYVSPITQVWYRDFATFFAAMMLFLQQRIAHTERKQRPRAFRRRQRIDPEPLITVVTLRQHEASVHAQTKEHGAAWSCRWIVCGHWRNQWYPKTRSHQPIWVRPYVKGPSDRPVRTARAKIFVVAK